MKNAVLVSVVLAFCVAAVGQAAQAPPAALTTASNALQDSAPQICSNGPVVADYGKKLQGLGNSAEAKIAKEVRHELLMLPYYSLFDDLEYCVQGRTVNLSGSLTNQHSETKRDAEAAVKRIEGVEQVVNNIKVLPPTPDDDRARVQVYRSLINAGGLSQYFWEAAPSIHIIVDNLHLTLKGYVDSEGDKDLAGITAKEVRSLFSATNDLQVVK